MGHIFQPVTATALALAFATTAHCFATLDVDAKGRFSVQTGSETKTAYYSDNEWGIPISTSDSNAIGTPVVVATNEILEVSFRDVKLRGSDSGKAAKTTAYLRIQVSQPTHYYIITKKHPNGFFTAPRVDMKLRNADSSSTIGDLRRNSGILQPATYELRFTAETKEPYQTTVSAILLLSTKPPAAPQPIQRMHRLPNHAFRTAHPVSDPSSTLQLLGSVLVLIALYGRVREKRFDSEP